jgi:hypothetical protein
MSHQPRLPALEPAACCTPEVPVTPPGVTPPDGGPGAGTDPKGSCQNCGDWMDKNYTDLIDANNDSVQEKAYALVEFGDMNNGDAQAQLAANRYAIDQSNICGITPGGNWKIVVLWFGGASPLPPTVWGINDFLALDPNSLAPAGVPYTSYKVQIFFTCEAHSGAY